MTKVLQIRERCLIITNQGYCLLEYHLIELELDGSFDTERIPTPVARDARTITAFQHKAPLRTSCCAHSLQLVIKDGFANSKNWVVVANP